MWTIPSGACCEQHSAGFVPASPNDGILPQHPVLHFLLQVLTILSGAYCAQYSAILVPATPTVGNLQQPCVLHSLLFTLTVPTGASYAQQSLVCLPSIPNSRTLPQHSSVHFFLLEKLVVPSLTCCPEDNSVVGVVKSRVNKLARVPRAFSACRLLMWFLTFSGLVDNPKKLTQWTISLVICCDQIHFWNGLICEGVDIGIYLLLTGEWL